MSLVPTSEFELLIFSNSYTASLLTTVTKYYDTGCGGTHLAATHFLNSKKRKPRDAGEEDGQCRPKDQGRFKGRVYSLLRHGALIKSRESEEDQGKEQLTGGADPFGLFQGFPRGGRSAHPVGPGSGFSVGDTSSNLIL